MLNKSVSYTILFILSLFMVNCHSNDTQVKDASAATATEVSQQVEAVKDNTMEAVSAAKAAVAEQMKEAKPTLTAAKEVLAEKATTETAKVKEVAADAKEVLAEKAKEVKKKEAPKKKKIKKRSKIKFDQTLHKFGSIKQGDVVKHDFKFKNTGNAPLVIKKVDVSCGCTFPSYPFIPIEPGKDGTISVTYDSKNKVGHQKPTITVVTNGRPRTLKLNLEGVVE